MPIDPNASPGAGQYQAMLGQLHQLATGQPAPQAPAPQLPSPPGDTYAFGGQGAPQAAGPVVVNNFGQQVADFLHLHQLVQAFERLLGHAPASQPAPQPAPQPAAPATYQVVPGDNLSTIAQKTLGDSNRWREIYDVNRDQLSDPNRIYPGQILKLPGGSAPQPAPQPTPQPAPGPAGSFQNATVAGSLRLIASGYKYPPNLTTRYYHDPGKVGCCADFVCDSMKEGGYDLNGVMRQLGMNPHYCPSMTQYFKQHQQYVTGLKGAQVGDAVFFNWSGGSTADHVAIVTAVDNDGRPTRITESYNFNLRARERDVTGSWNCILGYGRVVHR
jgi:LysM repeat protein